MGYIPTMPYARIIPAVVLGLLVPLYCQAQAPAPVPEGPTMAENQLDAATIKVRLMKQIAASIDQKVEMLNQNFKLEGNYYKDFTDPTKFLVRLQLKLVGLGDTPSTMLQVCDGKTLWDFQKVLKLQMYRKKEIQPIMKRLDESSSDPYFKSLVFSQLGFGGPEAMMTGLRKAVKFNSVTADKVDGVDVWVLGGEWVDRSLLVGMNDRALPPTAQLPPYVPSVVRIFVGQENGWPYKIVMTGNKPTMIQEETQARDPVTGRPVGVKKAPPKVEPTMITLQYKLLPLSEIKPGLFVFEVPADIPPESVLEETGKFLERINGALQMEEMRKKAEAAKTAEEPTLKTKPLEVGKQSDTTPDTFPPASTTPTPPK